MEDTNFYDKYWKEGINGKCTQNPPAWDKGNLNWHYDFFEKYIGKKILDVGAGDGTFLDFILHKKKKNIIEAVASELSEEAITVGKKKYPGIEFKNESLEKLGFKNDFFDTVFAVEVVEHLLDIDQCLDEVNRVLKNGGYFCVTTTDFNLPKKIIIAGLFWNKFFYPNNPHIRFFTKDTLVDICKKHGFELVDYKWNRSYFGLMPRGQMAVYRKKDFSLGSKNHFKESYDTRTFYPPDEAKFSVYSKKIWNRFTKIVSKDSKIADLGCGQGTLLYCLEKEGYKKLYGVDFLNVIPKGFVEFTKFIKGDVINVPLERESLDALVSTMVIEHVEENKFVDEVYRLLRKGGVALITSVLKDRFSWYFYRNSKGERVIEPTHLKEYRSVKEYEDLFSDKFEILEIKKPLLKYPIADPFFRILLNLTRSKTLWKLFTTNLILKKFRSVRIPIPGYYSIEILVRKK